MINLRRNRTILCNITALWSQLGAQRKFLAFHHIKCALFCAEGTIQSLIGIQCYEQNQGTTQRILQAGILCLLCKYFHIKSQRKQVEIFNIKENAKIYKDRIKKRTLNQEMKQQKHQSPPPPSEVRLTINETVHGYGNSRCTIHHDLSMPQRTRTVVGMITVRDLRLSQQGM
jgi:hypothetical protein